MFFRARRSLQRAWFNFNCRAILRTRPLVISDSSTTLVTMLAHGEVFMYLLAVKSFCHQLGRTPAIVVLSDGSLTASDRALLSSHIPSVVIRSVPEIATGRCPKGSCWERLMLISDLLQETFVLQLDSDTLTFNPIPEIQNCITENRSFTLLGDRSFPQIEPMLDAHTRYKNNQSPMVQAVCERSFDQLPEAASLNYLRGNAGFTGFARGSTNRTSIEQYSDLMRRIAGKTWDEWGSEQVASNLVISNTEGAVPLPFPKYCSYWAHPDVPYDKASFIHFIGPHRYSNGFYLRKALQVIHSLS